MTGIQLLMFKLMALGKVINIEFNISYKNKLYVVGDYSIIVSYFK